MIDNASKRLGDRYDDFVEAQVAAGEFKDADDVLRAGLRLLKRNQKMLETLSAEIRKGEESGEPQEFDLGQFLEEMHLRSDAG